MTTPNNENDTNNSNIDKVVVKIEQKTESVKKVDANAILSTGTLPDGTKYHVRLMRLDDVDEVLQVWKSIGLYEGTNTIQSFHAIDPEGFYVAVNEKDGSIIGEVGAVFIEPTTAFIGLYAVRPDCQKMGVGYAVWKQMMKHVGEANVGLYAIDTQYDMYRNKAKLEVEDPVKIVEFKKIGETSSETLANITQSINNVELVQVGVNDEIINQIISYDETVARHDRSKLIPLIIGEPDALCLAAIDQTSRKVLGYGVIHTSILDKAMVGPIFARSSNIAELLLYHLIDRFPMAKSSGFFLMTCDCNKDFMETAKKLNCTKEHILPRLFRSSYPQIEWSQVYCITSPNYTVV